MKFLILTALEGVERQEVRKLLGEVKVDYHPETNTDYYIGKLTINGEDHEVALGRTDQTNVNAGIETERAITYLKPDYLFFLGVAGGLKDVHIGDVVIAKDVYGYERGKAVKMGFLPRPNFGFSSYEMERIASVFSHSEEWLAIKETISHQNFPVPIEVFSGTIAAGEKVDASEESDLHQFLKINCSHALAVEMEGLGFLEVCRHHPHIKSLLIRGISDLVENKSAADKTGSQNFASQNAAKFLFGLIRFIINTKTAKKASVLTNEYREIFLKKARELYPEGLKDRAIWERAGGDLARIVLNGMNGRTQWFEALKLIENGGGGALTHQTLIREMLEDFPGSPDLLMLTRNIN